MSEPHRLHVATLNILNLADRWDERLPLLLADFATLQPDLIGLQEVVYVMQQDRLIGAAGAGEYRAVRGWAGRPEYGNSILVRVAPRADRRGPGRPWRPAVRSSRPGRPADGGRSIVFAVTHLHHLGPDEADPRRARRRRSSIGSTARRHPTARSSSATSTRTRTSRPTARMRAAGFRSAHHEANGAEPAVTWPSGLQAPAMDTDGGAECLDYIWVRGAIAVEDCRLVFDRPSATDPTVYPSDHFGLAAHILVG